MVDNMCLIFIARITLGTTTYLRKAQDAQCCFAFLTRCCLCALAAMGDEELYTKLCAVKGIGMHLEVLLNFLLFASHDRLHHD